MPTSIVRRDIIFLFSSELIDILHVVWTGSYAESNKRYVLRNCWILSENYCLNNYQGIVMCEWLSFCII